MSNDDGSDFGDDLYNFVFTTASPEVPLVLGGILLCCCCCLGRDYFICCYREHQARQRMRRLREMQQHQEHLSSIEVAVHKRKEVLSAPQAGSGVPVVL